MAQLPLKYNTKENDQGMDDYSALPAGVYAAHITASSYKETKAKTGHYIQLIVKILEGKFKGRTIFENLNLDNPNPIAVEIANKTLNSICKACDKVGVEDSAELHNIPFMITLKVVPKTATQPDSNSITMYKKFEGEMSSDAEAVNDVPEDAQTGAKKKLPWEK